MISKNAMKIKSSTKVDFDKLREKFSDTQVELDPSARQRLMDVGLYLGSMAFLSVFLVIYYAFIWTPHKLQTQPLTKSQL